MAQKQFKIGLSNSDKQNMAQDVYERLLALTFPEYNTTTQYEVGDFVVYNDQLYKCIGATSGAWDSTKWQLATLNDLVNDIENAVAFVNDKANVDGNYPTMTVGVADNLSPYDENSGDDQDEPFILQATGTGNGTQPDFSTGSIALMKEKQGNTVVVNQKVQNWNFTTAWNVQNGSGSVSNNIMTWTANAQGAQVIASSPSFTIGHKYLSMIMLKTTASEGAIQWYGGTQIYNGVARNKATTDWQLLAGLWTATQDNIYSHIMLRDSRASDWDAIQMKEAVIIDLTQWFNGDIPQDILDHPSNFFRYYQGSLAYNEGELVNSNGRYVKCIGMNQWDEEWELGALNGTTGQPDTSSTQIRSKNYCKCVGNADYYCYTLTAPNVFIWWYDTNKNYIDRIRINGFVRTAPANACYFKLTIYNNDNTYTAYTNDISINLYYEDEERCLTYEPYQVLTNNDTGNEVLRSAGSVKDYKTPDGVVHRLVGVIDLGTLNFVYDAVSDPEHPRFYTSGLQSLIKPSTSNVICSLFVYSNLDISDMPNMTFKVGSNGVVYIIDNSYTDAAAFKTAMSGVYLFYELEEPTTEQGTQFSENLAIDDFGSMDFQGTNGVPQGNLIFYPVDYKAFVDTLYNYADGTPSNIALKSDLSADKTELQGVDTQLLNAVGGTLRQLLVNINNADFDNTVVVDMGDLSYTYNSTYSCFTVDTTNMNVKVNNASINGTNTKYKCVLGSALSSADKVIAIGTTYLNGTTQAIVIKDSTYTDADTFKSAMKGVLLAYEKASE